MAENTINDLVKQFKDGEIDLHAFVEKVSGISWGICEWGSCQYATAEAMYETLKALKESGYDPTDIVGWGSLSELYDREQEIDFYDVITPIGLELRTEIRDYIDDCRGGLVDLRKKHSEEKDKEKRRKLFGQICNEEHYIIEQQEKLEKFKNIDNLDAVFVAMRESSWDLWSAAERVSRQVFGTNFETFAKRDVKSSGRGPVLNQLVQSGNYTTGLQCFMLMDCGFIKNPLESFSGFAT